MQPVVENATDCKKIRVVCSKPRTDVEVEVYASDTASDVLVKAGLNPDDIILMRPGDQQDFALTEPVFDQVAANSKLHAVPDATVGACVVYQQATERRGHQPPSPAYAQQVGWTLKDKNGDRRVYEGHYRTRHGLRWRGRVLVNGRERWFFIFRPPIEALNTIEERACFHAHDHGWWLIGFRPENSPADVSGGVRAVEVTLNKAYDEFFRLRRRA